MKKKNPTKNVRIKMTKIFLTCNGKLFSIR